MARKNRISLTSLANNLEAWLIAIVITIVLLRLPSLFEPHRYADEEIYLTLGQGLRKGLVFYKQIHDNKPPLLYLLAAFAGRLFWLRFILLAWQAFTLVVFFKLVKVFLKNKPVWVAGLTTLLFSLLTTLPLLEGNIANGENFMITPAILGAYLLWQNRQKWKVKPFFIAGILFAFAFLFKVPVFFDLLGLSLFLIFSSKDSLKKKFKLFFSPAFLMLIFGFVLPICASIIYYSLHGAFEPYVKAALLQNVGYLSSWETGTLTNSSPTLEGGLFLRGVVLFLTAAIFLVFQKHLSSKAFFASLWFIFALFGALLSGRPYPHYLLQVVPPLSLIFGLFIIKGRLSNKIAFLVLFLLLGLSVWHYRFWHYKSLPYYQNFLSFLTGRKSKSEYFAFFDGGVNRNYKVADYVLKHTLSSQKIFVWGTEPAIYALSDRLPVGRYTVSYHIVDFNAWQETIKVLEKEKPPLIIKMAHETKSFPELETLLSLYYTPAQTIDEATIYQRLY